MKIKLEIRVRLEKRLHKTRNMDIKMTHELSKQIKNSDSFTLSVQFPSLLVE